MTNVRVNNIGGVEQSWIPLNAGGTYSTIDASRELVAAPGEGFAVYIESLFAQPQGADSQTFTVKAGATTIQGPVAVAVTGALIINGRWLPENTALNFANSAAQSFTVNVTYHVVNRRQ